MKDKRTREKYIGDPLPLPWDECKRPELDCDRWTVPTRRGVVDAWGEFLQQFPLSSFVTFTWSDEAAGARYLYTDRAAVKDIERFLLRELKYPGQYFGVIEDHKHRNVPHAHLLMEDCVDWQFVHGIWKRTRGFFCSRPAESGAFYYVAKYVLKDGRCGERIVERLSNA